MVYQTKEGEMGWACSAYGGENKRVQHFCGKNLKKEITWKICVWMGG
jgi:hypothetical protein